MRWMKHYSFLIMIIVTSLIFGSGKVISVMEEQGIETPVTDLLHDSMNVVNKLQEKIDIALGSEKPKEQEEITGNEQQQNQEQGAENEQQQTQEQVAQGEQTKEPSVLTPEDGQPVKKEFCTVTLDYLDDALFIGDSRTEALYLYAGWKKVDFFVKTGIDIWQIFDKSMDGVYLEEKLAGKQYGKIYIMLGINELAVGTPESFRQQYETVLTKIREMQPEAIIFVQAIIHVSEKKDAEGTDINNQEIDIRNAELKKLTDNKTVFWIDANEIFDEKGTGKLSSEYSFDGVHLKVKNIEMWQEFLLQHGI